MKQHHYNFKLDYSMKANQLNLIFSMSLVLMIGIQGIAQGQTRFGIRLTNK